MLGLTNGILMQGQLSVAPSFAFVILTFNEYSPAIKSSFCLSIVIAFNNPCSTIMRETSSSVSKLFI